MRKREKKTFYAADTKSRKGDYITLPSSHETKHEMQKVCREEEARERRSRGKYCVIFKALVGFAKLLVQRSVVSNLL